MKNLYKIATVLFAVYLLSGSAGAVANDKPVAAIESDSPWVYACENFNLKSKSIDKDGFITRQEWTLDQNGKGVFLGSQPEIILGLPYTKVVGDLDVSLEVTDNSNDPATSKDTETIRLYTKPNPAPRIDRIDKSGFPNNRGSFYPGEKFSLNAVMYPDAIMRSAQVKWNYDKSIFRFSSDTVANPEVTVVLAPDSYEFFSLISVEVTNACGEKGSQEIRIPVRKIPVNSPPKIKLIVPGSANENTEFWISSAGSTTGNGYNEPEDLLSYSWSCNRQGVKENLCASGDNAILVRFPDGGILIEVSLKVCDEFGACDSAKSNVFIEETEDDAPIADASATARTAYSGEDVVLDCSRSSDDRTNMDQGVQTCLWTLTTVVKNTVITEQVFSKNKTQKHKFNISGIWNVQLQVRDGAMQLSAPNAMQINILKRTAPLAAIVGATPVAPQVEYAASTPVSKKELPPFVAPQPKAANASSAFLAIAIIVIAHFLYRQKNR